jgi:glycosyltransferase involved in cell wall biosynthesis
LTQTSRRPATVAIDARFAVGERRGIGKGSLELLRSLLQLDAPLFYELLVARDVPARETLIDARENWTWRRLRPGLYPLWEQVALPRYVRREAPAVLHSTGNTGPVALARAGQTKFLLTVHDLIFLEGRRLRSWRQRVGRLYRRVIVPAAANRAGWIIVDAEATRRQLIARYPSLANRISVVGIPIAERFFTYRPTERATQPPYFVAFGGIDPRKNVERIVRAFATVRTAQPSSELILVGTQGQLDAAPAGVRVRPYIAEDELLELYASAAGLVYPSLSEGFGVPILEATALGVPVITSDRDPMRELANEASILVDPEDTNAIAAAMTTLLRSADEYRRLAAGARRRAEPFRPRRIAEQMAELYLRLAGLRPA